MKTAPQEPESKPSQTQPADSESGIDTSKMSTGQRAALELTESARVAAGSKGSYAGGLFMGKVDVPQLYPFPEQSTEDRDQGDAFLQQLKTFLQREVDPDEIDRTGEIPQPVMEQLAAMGAFGIKIPRQYGGLGLSQTNYSRAAMLLGGYCGNLTALLSAHQSIGVPQPLLLFGTEEQKQTYLPRLARGDISAFALTEPSVGSDPATMQTTAEPAEDGSHYVINGEKLWCTNGTRAGVIIVMAKTPPKVVHGKTKNQITAFIVEMDSPGIEVTHRCRFMGLKALYNAVIRFRNVRVPKENIIWAEGKGLNVAFTTLNTGRLTLPAACVGLARRCLQIARQWANERVQWGAPIGHHAAIADKISRMAAQLFVMESMVLLASSRVDQDKNADIRLEAAMSKLWATETAWQIVNDTMQIRGGRGYETADSLRNRGEPAIGVERFLRDVRINTIFEGSSEIMRLFLAREALDKHLKIGGPMMNSQLPGRQRLRAAMLAGGFYTTWYPGLWWPSGAKLNGASQSPFNRHLRYVSRGSRRLSRSLFHAMLRNGPKLQREQLLLGRFVDIGSELFAISAACSRAQTLSDRGAAQPELPDLVHLFCRDSRLRIEHLFQDVRHNTDRSSYRMARNILDGKLEWLESGLE